MKTSLSQLAAFTTLLTCPVWMQAKPDLQNLRSMAPADSLIYFEAADIQQTSQEWNSGPWGQAWKSMDFDAYFSKLGMDEEDKEEGNKVLEEFQEVVGHLNGPAVFAMKVENFVGSIVGEDDGEEIAFNGFFAAGHNDKKFFVQSFDEDGATKVDSPKVDGFDVYVLENEEAEEGEPNKLYALLSDDTLLLALSEESAVKYGNAVKGKKTKEAGLAQSANFQEMLTRHPEQDMYLFTNLTAVGGIIDELIDQNRDSIEEAAANGQVVGADQLKQVIGYNTWQSWYMAGQLKGEEAKFYSTLKWEGDGGVLGQWMSLYETGFPQPEWVSADAASLNTASYDFGGLLRSVERLVGRISPMGGGMYTMMKNQLKMQQIDIDGNLIGNVGSELMQYVPAEMQGDQLNPVTFISLRDGPAFAQTLTMLTAMQGAPLPFEDYNGAQIATFGNPQITYDENGEPVEAAATPAPTIAITADQLIYGMSRDAVEQVVDQMSKEASKPLMQEPFIQDYIKSMSPDAVMFAYYDLEKMANVYIKAFAAMSGEEAEPLELEGDFITLGQGYLIDGGFEQEFISKPRK